jgi:adenylate cyclase
MRASLQRAIEVIEANMRLDPFPRLISSSHFMAVANYVLKQYGEAARLARECASRMPNVQGPHLLLGSACAQLGLIEEAWKETAEVLRINPGFTIEGFMLLAVYKNSEDLEHRLDGLRKSGLPET